MKKNTKKIKKEPRYKKLGTRKLIRTRSKTLSVSKSTRKSILQSFNKGKSRNRNRNPSMNKRGGTNRNIKKNRINIADKYNNIKPKRTRTINLIQNRKIKRTLSVLVTEKEFSRNRLEVNSLIKLMTIPIGIAFFRDYLCEQFNQENIMFWQEVKSFKQNCISKKQISKTAKKIIQKFIDTESLFEININSKCRNRILKQLDKKDFSIEMFDEAHQIVFDHMEYDSFDNFKLSKYYKNLIQHLKQDSTIDFISTKKKCTLIFRKNQQKKVLNDQKVAINEFQNGYQVAEELLINMLDLINTFYYVSKNEINFKQISKSIHFRKFVQMTSSLKNIRLKELNRNERICFFLNIFNTLTLHSFAVNGIPKDRTSVEKFMKSSRYQIENVFFSLNDILHGILRGNTHSKHNSPYFFLSADGRKRYSIRPIDPRIHFNIINYNFPTILTIYRSNTINKTLNKITKLSLKQLISKAQKKILLPKLFSQYHLDFGGNNKTFNWISKYIGKRDLNFSNLHKANTMIKFTQKSIKSPQIKFIFNPTLKNKFFN
ncbi:electron carrier/ protein disulfide oxidoreductase [Anaeramoeba flamelloides]|uniref:Electron carrier/ protein disulfide oxidoreductase n=1 Tax=Anaeramoeba flamelloides TaxID=1746091 RepID=A0AAV7YYV6_9EUKA|nr:electron carrier/ protein disulfide oxidoreductase [Anaeramoeba flamelloides]